MSLYVNSITHATDFSIVSAINDDGKPVIQAVDEFDSSVLFSHQDNNSSSEYNIHKKQGDSIIFVYQGNTIKSIGPHDDGVISLHDLDTHTPTSVEDNVVFYLPRSQAIALVQATSSDANPMVANLHQSIGDSLLESPQSIKSQKLDVVKVDMPYMDFKLAVDMWKADPTVSTDGMLLTTVNGLQERLRVFSQTCSDTQFEASPLRSMPSMDIADNDSGEDDIGIADLMYSGVKGGSDTAGVDDLSLTGKLSSVYGRLSSFATWPHSDPKSPQPRALAEAGFFMHPESLSFTSGKDLQSVSGLDRCVNFACKSTIHNWGKRGNPLLELQEVNPNSPMVRGIPCGNVPLGVTLSVAQPVQHGSDDQDIIGLASSAHTDLVASGSADGTIVLWNGIAGLSQVKQFSVIEEAATKLDNADDIELTHLNIIPLNLRESESNILASSNANSSSKTEPSKNSKKKHKHFKKGSKKLSFANKALGFLKKVQDTVEELQWDSWVTGNLPVAVTTPSYAGIVGTVSGLNHDGKHSVEIKIVHVPEDLTTEAKEGDILSVPLGDVERISPAIDTTVTIISDSKDNKFRGQQGQLLSIVKNKAAVVRMERTKAIKMFSLDEVNASDYAEQVEKSATASSSSSSSSSSSASNSSSGSSTTMEAGLVSNDLDGVIVATVYSASLNKSALLMFTYNDRRLVPNSDSHIVFKVDGPVVTTAYEPEAHRLALLFKSQDDSAYKPPLRNFAYNETTNSLSLATRVNIPGSDGDNAIMDSHGDVAQPTIKYVVYTAPGTQPVYFLTLLLPGGRFYILHALNCKQVVRIDLPALDNAFYHDFVHLENTNCFLAVGNNGSTHMFSADLSSASESSTSSAVVPDVQDPFALTPTVVQKLAKFDDLQPLVTKTFANEMDRVYVSTVNQIPTDSVLAMDEFLQTASQNNSDKPSSTHVFFVLPRHSVISQVGLCFSKNTHGVQSDLSINVSLDFLPEQQQQQGNSDSPVIKMIGEGNTSLETSDWQPAGNITVALTEEANDAEDQQFSFINCSSTTRYLRATVTPNNAASFRHKSQSCSLTIRFRGAATLEDSLRAQLIDNTDYQKALLAMTQDADSSSKMVLHGLRLFTQIYHHSVLETLQDIDLDNMFLNGVANASDQIARENVNLLNLISSSSSTFRDRLLNGCLTSLHEGIENSSAAGLGNIFTVIDSCWHLDSDRVYNACVNELTTLGQKLAQKRDARQAVLNTVFNKDGYPFENDCYDSNRIYAANNESGKNGGTKANKGNKGKGKAKQSSDSQSNSSKTTSSSASKSGLQLIPVAVNLDNSTMSEIIFSKKKTCSISAAYLLAKTSYGLVIDYGNLHTVNKIAVEMSNSTVCQGVLSAEVAMGPEGPWTSVGVQSFAVNHQTRGKNRKAARTISWDNLDKPFQYVRLSMTPKVKTSDIEFKVYCHGEFALSLDFDADAEGAIARMSDTISSMQTGYQNALRVLNKKQSKLAMSIEQALAELQQNNCITSESIIASVNDTFDNCLHDQSAVHALREQFHTVVSDYTSLIEKSQSSVDIASGLLDTLPQLDTGDQCPQDRWTSLAFQLCKCINDNTVNSEVSANHKTDIDQALCVSLFENFVVHGSPAMRDSVWSFLVREISADSTFVVDILRTYFSELPSERPAHMLFSQEDVFRKLQQIVGRDWTRCSPVLANLFSLLQPLNDVEDSAAIQSPLVSWTLLLISYILPHANMAMTDSAHMNTRCASCNTCPIVGARYRCLTRAEPIDICSGCFADEQREHQKVRLAIAAGADESQYDDDGYKDIYVKFARPSVAAFEPSVKDRDLGTTPFSQPILEDIYDADVFQQVMAMCSSQDSPAKTHSNAVEHLGVSCDICGVKNFTGHRFKCLQCDEFDLCPNCESNTSTKHFATHAFMVLPYPLPAPEENTKLPKAYVSVENGNHVAFHRAMYPRTNGLSGNDTRNQLKKTLSGEGLDFLASSGAGASSLSRPAKGKARRPLQRTVSDAGAPRPLRPLFSIISCEQGLSTVPRDILLLTIKIINEIAKHFDPLTVQRDIFEHPRFVSFLQSLGNCEDPYVANSVSSLLQTLCDPSQYEVTRPEFDKALREMNVSLKTAVAEMFQLQANSISAESFNFRILLEILSQLAENQPMAAYETGSSSSGKGPSAEDLRPANELERTLSASLSSETSEGTLEANDAELQLVDAILDVLIDMRLRSFNSVLCFCLAFRYLRTVPPAVTSQRSDKLVTLIEMAINTTADMQLMLEPDLKEFLAITLNQPGSGIILPALYQCVSSSLRIADPNYMVNFCSLAEVLSDYAQDTASVTPSNVSALLKGISTSLPFGSAVTTKSAERANELTGMVLTIELASALLRNAGSELMSSVVQHDQELKEGSAGDSNILTLVRWLFAFGDSSVASESTSSKGAESSTSASKSAKGSAKNTILGRLYMPVFDLINALATDDFTGNYIISECMTALRRGGNAAFASSLLKSLTSSEKKAEYFIDQLSGLSFLCEAVLRPRLSGTTGGMGSSSSSSSSSSTPKMFGDGDMHTIMASIRDSLDLGLSQSQINSFVTSQTKGKGKKRKGNTSGDFKGSQGTTNIATFCSSSELKVNNLLTKRTKWVVTGTKSGKDGPEKRTFTVELPSNAVLNSVEITFEENDYQNSQYSRVPSGVTVFTGSSVKRMFPVARQSVSMLSGSTGTRTTNQVTIPCGDSVTKMISVSMDMPENVCVVLGQIKINGSVLALEELSRVDSNGGTTSSVESGLSRSDALDLLSHCIGFTSVYEMLTSDDRLSDTLSYLLPLVSLLDKQTNIVVQSIVMPLATSSPEVATTVLDKLLESTPHAGLGPFTAAFSSQLCSIRDSSLQARLNTLHKFTMGQMQTHGEELKKGSSRSFATPFLVALASSLQDCKDIVEPLDVSNEQLQIVMQAAANAPVDSPLQVSVTKLGCALIQTSDGLFARALDMVIGMLGISADSDEQFVIAGDIDEAAKMLPVLGIFSSTSAQCVQQLLDSGLLDSVQGALSKVVTDNEESKGGKNVLRYRDELTIVSILQFLKFACQDKAIKVWVGENMFETLFLLSDVYSKLNEDILFGAMDVFTSASNQCEANQNMIAELLYKQLSNKTDTSGSQDSKDMSNWSQFSLNLLSMEETVSVCLHNHARSANDRQKIQESLAMMMLEEAEVEESAAKVVPILWDDEGVPSTLTVDTDDNSIVAGSGSNMTWRTVISDMGWDCGVHEFEFEIVKSTNGYMMLGACASNQSKTQYPGSSSSFQGWSMYVSNGYVYHNGSSKLIHTSGRIRNGDILRCELDLDAETISFAVNEGDMVLSHSDVRVPDGELIHISASLYETNDQVTMQHTWSSTSGSSARVGGKRKKKDKVSPLEFVDLPKDTKSAACFQRARDVFTVGVTTKLYNLIPKIDPNLDNPLIPAEERKSVFFQLENDLTASRSSGGKGKGNDVESKIFNHKKTTAGEMMRVCTKEVGETALSNGIVDLSYTVLPATEAHVMESKFYKDGEYKMDVIMPVFGHFAKLGGLKDLITVMTLSITDVHAHEYGEWLRQLKAQLHVPRYAQAFINNKECRDLLFKVMREFNGIKDPEDQEEESGSSSSGSGSGKGKGKKGKGKKGQKPKKKNKKNETDPSELLEQTLFDLFRESAAHRNDDPEWFFEVRQKAIEQGVLAEMLNKLSRATTTQHRESGVLGLDDVVKLEQEKKEKEREEARAKAKNKKEYWAKGTGYGTSQDSSYDMKWSQDEYAKKQKKEADTISKILEGLLNIIAVDDDEDDVGEEASDLLVSKLPDVLFDIMEKSCLLDVMESYLRNDSVMDMAKFISLYQAILNLAAAFAAHEVTLPLLGALEHGTPLSDLVDKQKATAVIMLKNMEKAKKINDGSSKDKKKDKKDKKDKKKVKEIDYIELVTEQLDDNEEIKLARNIIRTSEQIKRRTEAYKMRQNKGKEVVEETEVDVSSSSSGTVDEQFAEMYCETMAELQFDESDMTTGGSYSSHHYASRISSETGSNAKKMNRLVQETGSLSTSLPLHVSSSVFFRVDEDRLDVMQFMITGPEDTPYMNGCFQFDLYCPDTFPNGPPLCNLETTGHGSIRFNPNLYNCGKVCLSLLGTWSGGANEQWNEKTSTLLQLLVSIQSLILVPEPYFNEPGYESSRGTPSGDSSNWNYNEVIRVGTIQWAMIDALEHPPNGFEEVVETHFTLKKHQVWKQVNQWLDEANKRGSSGHKSKMKTQVAKLKTLLDKLDGEPLEEIGSSSSSH